MKVIDLLNKIANGEEPPKKFKFKDIPYNKEFYFDGDIYKYKDYDGEYAMTEDVSIEMVLDNEIEIIEEDKKIEEIDMFDYFTGYDYGGTNKKLLKDLEHNFETLNSKINEIIDYINKEK